MTRPSRFPALDQGTRTYFVSTNAAERRMHFRNPRWAELMLEILLDYRNRGKYLLHDFTVMPEHLHLTLTPKAITLERAVQFFKGGFSFRASRAFDYKFDIWQRGFTDHRL